MLDCNYCGREIDVTELALRSKFAMGELDEAGEPQENSFVHTNAICECGNASSYELSREEANA